MRSPIDPEAMTGPPIEQLIAAAFRDQKCCVCGKPACRLRRKKFYCLAHHAAVGDCGERADHVWAESKLARGGKPLAGRRVRRGVREEREDR